MTFYQTLTPYYDQIFPANQKQINFINDTFEKGSSLLDVGAGTGNVACALVEEGYVVTASEPEEMMAAKIKEKAAKYDGKLHVLTDSMQELEKHTDSYDGIYCNGNTLVHLHDMAEITTFLQQACKKLKEHGKLIIQIVNYDKVLVKKDFKFPIMNKETFTFERSYELSGEHVLFTTTLTVDSQKMSNTIPLFPATKDQLEPVLRDSGFTSIEFFANFEKAPYTADAPALILVAAK
ncbi:class I SAM-dependent methyltransferase [Brevibacillus daliensis]|uniref:class I SAM-dependent methyltransferase n=1 Tax=Brevibacillus daliensis TaxID=2892995 RepID=UPI001E4C1B76|nr:methyltransferase domain-containing protein [Brevibacillus daliensis]